MDKYVLILRFICLIIALIMGTTAIISLNDYYLTEFVPGKIRTLTLIGGLFALIAVALK